MKNKNQRFKKLSKHVNAFVYFKVLNNRFKMSDLFSHFNWFLGSLCRVGLDPFHVLVLVEHSQIDHTDSFTILLVVLVNFLA